MASPFTFVRYTLLSLLLSSISLLSACRAPANTLPPIQPTASAKAASGANPTTSPPAATGFNPGTTTIRLEQVATGLRSPIAVTHAADGSGRLFVVEKGGTIRIIRDGQVVAQPYLTISALVRASGSEQGLLGLAFHPRYRDNGLFYVNYTDPAGDTVVARYRVSANADQADATSAVILLTVDQPFGNHNGGHLAFGPDGYLYIGLGDGGSGGDPRRNGQNLDALLGKMLRIDVDQGDPYGIPADNPFRTQAGARPEIWAYGLRNPWRYSFDRATGDLYIADVGQNAYEEVSFQAAASRGGENYGWNRMEGSRCYPASATCDQAGLVLPIGEYGRDRGCSVTGGFVYRGVAQPDLFGAYFFADYCTGWFWALQRGRDGRWTQTELVDTDVQVSSFGEDESGELYVTDYSRGGLWRLIAAPRN